jgi:hypothetical protein
VIQNTVWLRAGIFILLAISASLYALRAGLPDIAPSKREAARANIIRAEPVPAATRLPTLRAEASQAGDATESEALRLVGVIQVANGSARALLRKQSDGTSHWLSVGGEWDGWRLRKVAPAIAVIESNGRQVELQLYRKAPSVAEATLAGLARASTVP